MTTKYVQTYEIDLIECKVDILTEKKSLLMSIPVAPPPREIVR